MRDTRFHATSFASVPSLHRYMYACPAVETVSELGPRMPHRLHAAKPANAKVARLNLLFSNRLSTCQLKNSISIHMHVLADSAPLSAEPSHLLSASSSGFSTAAHFVYDKKAG